MPAIVGAQDIRVLEILDEINKWPREVRQSAAVQNFMNRLASEGRSLSSNFLSDLKNLILLVADCDITPRASPMEWL